MFESLSRYQGELSAHLAQQIEEGTFAQVNLFAGPAYSLRLTAALECIRVLDCLQQGSDHCSCPSCRSARTVTMENLLIVSRRDHRSIIESNLAAWQRLATDYTKEQTIRSLRTLLLSYHPQLNTLGEASALADVVGQFIQSSGESESERDRWAQEIRRLTKRLFTAAKKSTTITVAQVRSIAEWVSRSAIGSQKRFIIIEALEDTNPSARNALLKLLEEPPTDVYFFLISEHPARIMQTILSRARLTRFASLSDEALRRYVEPYYPKKGYRSLEEFYLESGGLDITSLAAAAETLVSSLTLHRRLSPIELAKILAEVEKMDGYEQLLRLMLGHFEQRVRSGALAASTATRYVRAINESYYHGELYNQDVKMMGQGLYYTLLEVR